MTDKARLGIMKQKLAEKETEMRFEKLRTQAAQKREDISSGERQKRKAHYKMEEIKYHIAEICSMYFGDFALAA